MKTDTIEQFKILEFLENNFNMSKIKVELYSKKCIKIIDENGEEGYFEYNDGKVELVPF